MVLYKCFYCGNKIKSAEVEKRFVCPECGARVFFKPRTKMKKVSSD